MRLPVISIALTSLALTGCATTPLTPSPVAVTVPGDVDGDGVADSITQKKVDGRWQLVVATRSGTVTHVFDSDGNPDGPDFVATAPLDPVAGVEVIYTGPYEGGNFRVVTWRNGALVDSPSPQGSLSWVTSDEFDIHTGYTFAETNGQPTLTTSELNRSNGSPVTYVTYGWASNGWVAQRTWTEALSLEQQASLCTTFCGVTMVPLARK